MAATCYQPGMNLFELLGVLSDMISGYPLSIRWTAYTPRFLLGALVVYRDRFNLDALRRFHLMDCIECGCCAYACPGKVPLVEGFRVGKRALKEGVK